MRCLVAGSIIGRETGISDGNGIVGCCNDSMAAAAAAVCVFIREESIVIMKEND